MSYKDKVYAAKIGPDTEQEATEIHRGVYDGFVKVWRPDTFVRKLLDFRKDGFKEFEDNDKHYYVGLFVSCFALKYLSVGLALMFFPQIVSYL